MITLVFIRDCHSKNNVKIDVREEEKAMFEKLGEKTGYKVAVSKPKQPTCDNCDNMTIRKTGSGNHRHCDLLGLYIPDHDMFPSCDLHSAIAKFTKKFEGKKRLENTIKEGGAK